MERADGISQRAKSSLNEPGGASISTDAGNPSVGDDTSSPEDPHMQQRRRHVMAATVEFEQVTFCGVQILAAPGVVMVPQRATDALVTLAVERIGSRAARVADVGTGTGAVAVAVALRSPRA